MAPPARRKGGEKTEAKIVPSDQGFRAWKLALRGEVASVSGDPERGFAWILQVEARGVTLATLAESGEFPTLDAKLAAALSKATTGEFARRINIVKEERAVKGLLLKGRQILFLIYQHYRMSEVEGHTLDFQDPLAVVMAEEDLKRFLNDWEISLAGLRRTVDGIRAG